MSQSEAARIRGVSKQAISKLIKRGRLQSLEIGGHIFVKRSDIQNFVPGKAGRPKGDETDE